MEWLKQLPLILIAALAPIHGLMLIVGFLIFSDLVTGIIAAYQRGESIKSGAMRRTISKMLVYQLAVVSAFQMEVLMPGLLPFAKLAAGAIGLVEFKSILENVESFVGEPIFKKIIRALGSDNDKQEPKA